MSAQGKKSLLDLCRAGEFAAALDRLQHGGSQGLEEGQEGQEGQEKEDSLGEQLNQVDEDGRTPLHWCISLGGRDEQANLTARRLLGMGTAAAEAAPGSGRKTTPDVVIVDTQDGSGLTPLHSACASGSGELVRAVLRAFASQHEGDDAALQAFVNRLTKAKRTALHYACSAGALDVVTVLLEFGAKVSPKDRFGATALHRAAGCSKAPSGKQVVEMCKMLLDAGANGDAVDSAGDTAFHVACMEHNADLCVYLLEVAQVDNGVQNADGKYALQLAPHDLQDRLVPIVKRLRGIEDED